MIVVGIIGLLAMLALPSFTKARAEAQKTACINNLRVIETAKEMWAFDAMASPRARPNQQKLTVYLRNLRGRKNNRINLNCPLGKKGRFGQSYVIGRMDQRPRCKKHPDHRL